MTARLAICIALLTALVATTAFGQQKTSTPFGPVQCEGAYERHLQGVCTDGSGAIFWSFTTVLVKTDVEGKVQKSVAVGDHHGDLCYRDGKVYVAVNFGKFNDAAGNADSWVYVYNAADLSLAAKHATPQVFHGAGGMAQREGRFIVVGGLPEGFEENYLYEYDAGFKFVKKHVLKSGQTRLGIQTAEFAEGRWWFGCYGARLLVADGSLKLIGGYDFDCAYGVVGAGSGKFLVARDRNQPGRGHVAELVTANPDDSRGLVVTPK